MTKPTTAEGYENKVTENCERVLVTLIRGLGPWRDSIFLIGGLTPRYLTPSDHLMFLPTPVRAMSMS